MTYLQATCNTHLPRLQTLATATWLELSYGRIRQLGATVDSHHGGLDQEDLDQNDLDYDPWPAHYSLSDPSVVSFLFQTLKTNGWKGPALTYHCVPDGEKKSHIPHFPGKTTEMGAVPIIGQFPLLWSSYYLFPGVAWVCFCLRASAPTKLEHVPVEDVVVGEALPVEQVSEQLPQVTVVWLLLKSERPTVVEIGGELTRSSLAQHVDWCGHLLLRDPLVLLLLRCSPQALPWQGALDEVHEDIAETLHVVPSALLDAKVGVDRGVPSCPREVLVFSVWYVLVCPCVPIFFGKPEVDDIHKVSLFAQTHEEVVRLDIPVDEVLAVDVLDP